MKNKKSNGRFYLAFLLISLLVLGGLFFSTRGKTLLQTLKPEAAPSISDDAGVRLNELGLKISVSSAEVWEDPDEFWQPKEGEQFIRLFLEAENIGVADRIVCSEDFACYANNVKMDYESIVGDDALFSETISPGRKIEKYLYYSVPAGAAQLELEYHPILYPDFKKVYPIQP